MESYCPSPSKRLKRDGDFNGMSEPNSPAASRLVLGADPFMPSPGYEPTYVLEPRDAPADFDSPPTPPSPATSGLDTFPSSPIDYAYPETQADAAADFDGPPTPQSPAPPDDASDDDDDDNMSPVPQSPPLSPRDCTGTLMERVNQLVREVPSNRIGRDVIVAGTAIGNPKNDSYFTTVTYRLSKLGALATELTDKLPDPSDIEDDDELLDLDAVVTLLQLFTKEAPRKPKRKQDVQRSNWAKLNHLVATKPVEHATAMVLAFRFALLNAKPAFEAEQSRRAEAEEERQERGWEVRNWEAQIEAIEEIIDTLDLDELYMAKTKFDAVTALANMPELELAWPESTTA